MAKLTSLPARSIISALKGHLDYYVWMGIPVVRRWPRRRKDLPGHGERQGWQPFATAARLWTQLTPRAQTPYHWLAGSSGLSARDCFTRAYLSGLYRNPRP